MSERDTSRVKKIPGWSRTTVINRDMARCQRCGGPGSQWHHRRSRSVRDWCRHCPCNGVWLCSTCHNQVHANPLDAMREGFIVSRHAAPRTTPIASVLFGSVLLTCEGGYEPIEREEST